MSQDTIDKAVAIGVPPPADVTPADFADFRDPDEFIVQKMADLVKGQGMAVTHKPTHSGEVVAPLSNPDEVYGKTMVARKAFLAAVREGVHNPDAVFKSMSPDFARRFSAFGVQSPQNQLLAKLFGELEQMLGKNFTTTVPLSTGIAPVNLRAPSRLLYPSYSPLRNKISRTQGMGLNLQQKLMTGIAGSQTGSSGGSPVDISIPELVSGGSSMANWPLNLPPSAGQDMVDTVVPYRFAGLTESVSWLAEFSSQGFEDLVALANLVLLQKFQLGEEYSLMCATSTVLAAPSAPTVTVRTANSGETALSGSITDNKVDVKVTACNWYGESAPSAVSVASSVTSGTHVVDVQIAPVAGALWYNIYQTVGTTPGTYYQFATKVGGRNYTLQGAVLTSGTGIPAADTGTYATTRMEGLIPVIAGHSQGSGQVYPSGWQGGYINLTAGDTLGISVLNTALQGVYNGSGAFRADPAELIGEASDIMRLSDDIVQAGNATNYRLHISSADANGVRAGAAVSEFINPMTRSIVRIVVHPWWSQGQIIGMTYQLPNPMSRVPVAWEMNMVQDYLSITWPVIDATYRSSMFTYGALSANAPQYSFIVGGLQRTNRSGSTGTWS